MALGTGRGPTADAVAGVDVAAVESVDGSLGIVQAIALVASKTDYPELARTSVAAADTASDLSTAGFAGAGGANLTVAFQTEYVQVRATCSATGAVLTGHIVAYDVSENCLWEGAPSSLVFVSGVGRIGATGNYTAAPQTVAVGDAVRCAVYIDTLSSGTWDIYARPTSVGPGLLYPGALQATGDGATTAFALPQVPFPGSVEPFAGGVLQSPSNVCGSLGWTLAGATVTFGTAPQSGIDVRILFQYQM